MASETVRLPRLLTVKQLAAETGLPVWRIHEMAARGEGPPRIRIGRTYRFPEDGVRQWMREQSNNNKEGT